MNPESITIFTDGSSRGNPGPGGWGAILVGKFGSSEVKVKEIGGREVHTTNNRMELTAAIKALEHARDIKDKIQVFSDSSYVVNGITKWVHGWERKGWKTADRKSVLNQDLWEALLGVSRGRDISWKQIAGHGDTAGNIRADEIATAFADLSTSSRQAAPELYSGVLGNYKIRDVLNVAHG